MKKSAGRKGFAQTVIAPVSVGYCTSSTKPGFSAGRSREFLRVQHRELAGTLGTAVGNFNLDPISAATPGYDLNPGNSRLFPWLSQTANLFEQYRFVKVVVRVVPTQATSVAGRCYLAVDLDIDDSVPVSAQQLMSNKYAVEGPMWQAMELACPGVDLMRDMPWKYCSAQHRVNPEPRTAYCGFLCFGATSPTAGTWDLWIEYDVEFRSPCLDPLAIVGPLTAVTSPSTACLGYSTNAAISGSFPYSLACVPWVNDPGYPMTQVASGQGGVPILQSAVQSGAARVGCGAFDLANMIRLGGGLFEWTTTQGLTGRAPDVQLPISKYSYGVESFDASGGPLGGLQIVGTASAFSPILVDNYATQGAEVRGHGSWAWRPADILGSPNLRYFMVWLLSKSINDLGAGVIGMNWRFAGL